MAIVHLIRDKQPQAHIIVMVRPSYMQMRQTFHYLKVGAVGTKSCLALD